MRGDGCLSGAGGGTVIIDLDIIGDTPSKRGGIFVRELEVLQFLESFEPEPRRVVVFDDRPEPFLRLRDFHVLPTPGDVMGPQDIEPVDEIFKTRWWPFDMRPEKKR